MFPGMGKINPQQMKQMMRQMGISTEDVEASEVHIMLKNGKVRKLTDVSVSIMTVQGQKTYTINAKNETDESPILPEDVDMVVTAVGVSKEVAQHALEENDGDIAKAIESLKKD